HVTKCQHADRGGCDECQRHPEPERRNDTAQDGKAERSAHRGSDRPAWVVQRGRERPHTAMAARKPYRQLFPADGSARAGLSSGGNVMSEARVVATGLCFPEGPVAMADASVVLVEIERQTLSRVLADGTVQVIARTGGGPNGAALGPDGAFYVCNNGGFA